MALSDSFVSTQELGLAEEFYAKGYVVRPVDNRAELDELRHEVCKIVCAHTKQSLPTDESDFLNNIHKTVPVAQLNDMRLAVYNGLNNFSWCRPTYYRLARAALDALLGNELAMQNKINLSVQYPNDESSLLGVHADAWSGETPYQAVVWLPLVDVYDTKSMYILDPATNRSVASRMKTLAERGGSSSIYEEYSDKFEWVKIPYGSLMVFSPNLLHGNIVNRTPESRWSFNCRFTGLFTPYASEEKRLGNFYLPITAKPVSRVGMRYRNPEGFDE